MPEIHAETRIPERTLYKWREREGWDNEIPTGSIEEQVSRRICCLLDKPNKTAEDIAELGLLIDKLGDLSVKLATARQMDRGATAAPVSETTGEPVASDRKPRGERRRDKREREKKAKNDISAITAEQIDKVRGLLFRGVKTGEVHDLLLRGIEPKPPVKDRDIWEYLALWYANRHQRNRFILKSRQIGATYYFAWEALEDAIKTGDNQIFLSASRDQAEVFRAYIVMFGIKCLGIELTGNPIILSNGAELRFLSTNSRTAQSYHGHLYMDEVFWIPQFAKMWTLASAMAAHKRWRRTLFSTPSALSHEAYAKWSGEEFNKGKPDHRKREFDVSWEALKDGVLGPDKIWRHIVTVEDAERQGCDLFDIDELKQEYSEADFANLFMCKFIDDAKSVFSLALLLACGVPDTAVWKDYQPDAARPFGNKPVALGYDPSRSRDDASLVIMAVPLRPLVDPWRVLKRLSFAKQSFDFQAARIKEVCDSYNVVHIGIDVSGMGWGVYELIQRFYPNAEPITYSPQMKTQLVMKALHVIQPPPRLQYDAGDKAISQAFMMIRETTSSTGQITYVAQRSGETGHADPAWAIMHALKYEPLGAPGEDQATVSVLKGKR